MANDRAAEADAIATAYWASVARLGDKDDARDAAVQEEREADIDRALAGEQVREAERAGSAEDDETKRQAKSALRPRLRQRL